MGTKEKLAKEYAEWLHKEVEEYYGQSCKRADMNYRYDDIEEAFLKGWDAAVDYLAKLPFDKMLKYFNEALKDVTMEEVIEENKDVLNRLKDK